MSVVAVSVKDKQHDLNDALQTLTYTPGKDCCSAKLTVTSFDEDNNCDEQTNSTTSCVEISIHDEPPVNHVPDAQTVDENGTLHFNDQNGNAISVSDTDCDVNKVILHGDCGTLFVCPS